MSVKKVIGKVHLYLSLVFGIFIVLLCVSGSILVFDHDIKKFQHPELYNVSAGNATYSEIESNIKEAYPNGKINRIYTPEGPFGLGTYLYWVKEGKTVHTLSIDPGTGEINGNEGDESPFIVWLKSFHSTLLIPVYGIYVVAWIGFILAFILLTGLYMWWPGIKKTIQGLKLRKNAPNSYARFSSWHKVIGVYTIPILLVITLSGALIPFYVGMLGWFGIDSTMSAEELTLQPTPEGELPLDVLLAKLKENEPNNNVLSQIRYPASPEKAIEFRTKRLQDPGFGSNRIYMNQYTGEIIGKQGIDTTPGWIGKVWLFPIHTAVDFSMFLKIVYALAGLVPVFLMFSGLYIWWFKRRKRRQTNTNEQLVNKHL
ncbi:putative iron-regulated membrane protein [Cytobacillus firmus]|uniref:Putative iron-regulated membrane protein n=2 Tax=Cytobacillus TaxID=2675230 RepID=A0A366JC55_CYTFI|nr:MULTISPECIES: PepSY-associated TM helix domain-containing protein [Cytobacillus]RBP84532.1 putative iron-regulated membrane protein [Cytobacillus firmus]TDX34781.1 putative iron-regulated membrane protein [Cytobacillus oceanisediminis]